LLDRRLLVVTGKGGVGKTTIAAALAALAAQHGRRVLLVELDPLGALSDAIESPALGFEPLSVFDGVSAMAMDTEAALAEYLRLFVRIPVLGRLGPVARTFDFVAQAAPGVREILTIGKLCHEVRQESFDLIVADAPASGHVVELLTAPRVIHDLVQVGMVRSQTTWMLDIVEDPDRTGVVVVTTPEELPVNETIEMLGRWRAESGAAVAAVIANRVLPEPFGQREQTVFEALAAPEHQAAVLQHGGGDLGGLVEATRWAVARRRLAASHLGRLRTTLGGTPPLLLVPDVSARSGGRRLMVQVRDHLGDELDVVPA
jgi:anion-transporting  ArsA/GET3 family ATPase